MTATATATAETISPPKKKQIDPTLLERATAALAKANGHVVEATNALAEQVSDDPTLYRSLMDPLVREAAYSVITGICRHQRRNIWLSAQPSAAETSARVVSLGNAITASLLDFPLPGGLRLRDAMRGDVEQAAEFYGRQAHDMRHKAQWLALIAKQVPDDKTVGKILNEKKLATLRAEAGNV